MSWRDSIPPDKVLTDAALDEMRLVATVLPNLKFDVKRAYDPNSALSQVTLSRVLLHHQALATEIERLRSELGVQEES